MLQIPLSQDAEKNPLASFSVWRDPQQGPGRLTTRRRAQTWCSLFVAPCAPAGTQAVLFHLRPCLGQDTSMGKEAVSADSGRVGEIPARAGRVRRLIF